jgi:hypothetical protein
MSIKEQTGFHDLSATAPSQTYFGLEDVPDGVGHTPEPASFVLLVTGAGVLVLLRRVHSRAKQVPSWTNSSDTSIEEGALK